MSSVKRSGTTKETSLCAALIPYLLIQENENYSMYHSKREVPLTLFMNLDLCSNMLSGSVSERLIRVGGGGGGVLKTVNDNK